MRKRQLTSGDLIADRRVACAAALAEAGDFAAAAELVQQALELVPGWTAGWSLLGEYLERSGHIEGAKAAWRRLSELDTERVFGAALKLAAYGEAKIHATDPAFVAALFDDYAERFEAQLVQKLRYAVPQAVGEFVATALSGRGAGQLAHAIDLGCGTGLMGERLRRYVSYLEGVDLSGGMIGKARRKAIYDTLAQDELVRFLAAHRGGVDLLTAADVFNYCGDLEPVVAAAARVLVPGGLLAFSLEAHAGPEPIVLRPSLRYAHEPEAARRVLRAGGFEVLRFEQAVLRHDRGEPVVGYLVLASRAGRVDAAVPDAIDMAAIAADEPAVN